MAGKVPIIDNFLMHHGNIKRYGCEHPKFLQLLLTGDFIWSKDQESKHAQFSRELGVSYDKALQYRWILHCWKSEPEIEKGRISKLITDLSLLGLQDNLFYISDCLFLWSKNLLVEPVLGELAKFVIANQIASDVSFTLNQKKLLEEINKKPAHAPNKKDEIYLNTLMVYLDLNSKRKAAIKLGVRRKTISNHIEKVVGEYYLNLQDHPQLAKIKKAYDIWKSIKEEGYQSGK